MVVGFMRFSPSDVVPNSSGSPPACCTPRRTAVASPRKWRLQLTSSDHGLQMPITGWLLIAELERPSERSDARWMNPLTPGASSQRALLREDGWFDGGAAIPRPAAKRGRSSPTPRSTR